MISRPTRITRNSATLIDNILVSQDLIDHYRCGLLTSDLSDHLPCLLLIEKTDPDMNGYNLIASCKISDTKMANIKDELNSTDWAVTLNNPNLQSNYDTFETMLTNILDKHTPVIV